MDQREGDQIIRMTVSIKTYNIKDESNDEQNNKKTRSESVIKSDIKYYEKQSRIYSQGYWMA